MPSGGARPGSGRPKGSKTVRTAAKSTLDKAAAEAQASGAISAETAKMKPLDVLLKAVLGRRARQLVSCCEFRTRGQPLRAREAQKRGSQCDRQAISRDDDGRRTDGAALGSKGAAIGPPKAGL
jgi:hypothetical protein